MCACLLFASSNCHSLYLSLSRSHSFARSLHSLFGCISAWMIVYGQCWMEWMSVYKMPGYLYRYFLRFAFCFYFICFTGSYFCYFFLLARCSYRRFSSDFCLSLHFVCVFFSLHRIFSFCFSLFFWCAVSAHSACISVKAKNYFLKVTITSIVQICMMKINMMASILLYPAIQTAHRVPIYMYKHTPAVWYRKKTAAFHVISAVAVLLFEYVTNYTV